MWSPTLLRSLQRSSAVACGRLRFHADPCVTVGNESVPIQLAQCWFPGLAISNAKLLIYFSKIKYTEAILSNSTRKQLWLEVTEMLIAVKKLYCVIYYNFRRTFYQRDAMLARVLAVALCLSICVCLSQVGALSKRVKGLICFLAWRLHSISPTLCFK